MSTLASPQSKHFSDLLTFGRSETRIFGLLAGETIFLGATLFVAEPPFLPVPMGNETAILSTAALAIILAGILYVLLSDLGYQTYSVTFHHPIHILKCWAAYLALSTIVIYLGYLLLVYPYTESLVPKPVDIGIGAVLIAAYAISATSIIYGESIFSGSTDSKSEDIGQFLSAADDLKEKSEPDIDQEPERLIQAGESILLDLQTSELEGTGELATNFQDWLETFKHRELQGQKKMVGDLPETSTRFTVWENRCDAFQDLQEELEKMTTSATRRVLLSTRDK